MGVKDEMLAMLRAQDDAGIAAIVATRPRAVRHLLPRMWDSDPQVRAAAARGIGEVAVRHPELAREIIRRALWGLNDESATNGGSALIGLGEIGRRSPSLLAPYVPALASMAEDEGLRPELFRALAAVASVAPDVVAPHLPELTRAATLTTADERDAFRTLEAACSGDRR